MKWEVIYTRRATEDLSSLPHAVAQRVADKIKFFKVQIDPLAFAKRLTQSSVGTYRFRIGNYRAIFDVDHKVEIRILLILRIRHRKDVYDL